MKRVMTIMLSIAVILGITVHAEAGLQTIGTATYGGSDYNLIYDNDDNLVWLDYTNSAKSWYGQSWLSQNGWASGLNTGGTLTYNLNAGLSMDWGTNLWRLPTVTDTGNDGCNFGYSGTDCGYNVDTSTGEMAQLWFDELGNLAYYDTLGNENQPGWGLTNTGNFQNLQTGYYWSGTEYSADPTLAWDFSTSYGHQGVPSKYFNSQGIAVRSGQLAVVPEPLPTVLFLIGGVLLAGRMRYRQRN